MSLRFVAFDFDGTLSASHIWNALSGSGPCSTPLPPPYSRTEHGQLTRIVEIDASSQYGGPGGFALAVFGGRERVQKLEALLQYLAENGIECVVCSRSLVGPLRKLLDQVGLLPFFTNVFGTVGAVQPPTEWDMQLPVAACGAEARYLGSEDVDLKGSKRQTLAAQLKKRSIGAQEALFIDDMPQEIEDVTGVCRTLHCKPMSGMGAKEIDYIRVKASEGRVPCDARSSGAVVSSDPSMSHGTCNPDLNGNVYVYDRPGDYFRYATERPPPMGFRPTIVSKEADIMLDDSHIEDEGLFVCCASSPEHVQRIFPWRGNVL